MNCGWLSAGGLSAACTFDRQRYFFFEAGLSAAVVLWKAAQGCRMAPPTMWAVVWMPALVDHAYFMNSYFILAGCVGFS